MHAHKNVVLVLVVVIKSIIAENYESTCALLFTSSMHCFLFQVFVFDVCVVLREKILSSGYSCVYILLYNII